MRRILTLLLLTGMVSLHTRAQVLFSQDFESGTITPMKAVDVDQKTIASNIANIAGPTWKVYNRNSAGSDRWAVSTSWFNPIGQADDWLISPPIEITDQATFLTWRAFTPDASYRDGYQVRISTTTDEIASFTDVILNLPQEETTIRNRALSLGAYVGQTIYFAFRNNSVDKFLLYIDDIQVEVLPRVDLRLTEVKLEKYNRNTSPINVTSTVYNRGGETVSSLVYSWSLGENVYTDTLTDLAIPSFGSADITHSVPLYLAEGEFYITTTIAEVDGHDDVDSTDNGGTQKIYGMSRQLPKKVVVEEATGTWCGWCPRGTVNMDRLAEQHSDVAIPIAVHNNDPMAIAPYDGPLGTTIGGYPSGHVDRKHVDIDPSEFVASVLSLQNRVVPVQVDVETTFDEISRNVVIRGNAFSSIPTENNDFRFVCVITEDDVTGTGTAWAQVNYYANNAFGPMGGYENLPDPVPASQMVYNFVARAILGGFFGMESSVPDAVGADEEFSFEFTYQVPQQYNVDRMKAIVFLLDEKTGEILNGEVTSLAGTVSVPLIPEGRFSLYPNPTSDILNLSLEHQTDAQISMRVYTVYGSLVKDLGDINLSGGTAYERINVADLQAGMYILELRNKNAVTALPFTRL